MIKPIECCQLIFTEYSELRQEIRSFFQIQTSILTIFVSFVGALIGVVVLCSDVIGNLLIAIICFSILPGISSFFGVVFLDLVFRQVYLGRYLSNVEKETLAFIKVFLKCDLPSGIFCWETELQKEDHKFFATNRLRYYFFIGMFLIVPPLSVYIGITLLCQSIQTILQLHNIYLLIGLFTYILFAIFLVIYIIRILRL